MPDTQTYSFWKRLIVGGLMIVVASATATAAFAFNELDRLAAAFAQGGVLDLGAELDEAAPSEPQTIMLIGSDERANSPATQPGEFGDPRSDTVILVRLDPAEGATALLSLPRDLRVQIPGHGVGKLNDAYSYGGPELTVRTVKQLTGLQINHVVNVDFGGFIEAVNQLGCVYVDVDRDYFSSGTEYAYINLNAGYQRLCGEDALAYVRFRHEDTDLIRAARQQEFLRQLKEQISVAEAVADREGLLDIFGRNTDSDIGSREETLTLLKLAIDSAGVPIREVHFQGDVGQVYITASDQQIERMTSEFLGVEDTQGPRPSGNGGGGAGSGEGVDSDDGDGGGDGGSRGGGDQGDEPDLVDASGLGRAQAEQARAENARLPIFYPTRMTPGSSFPIPPSVYEIEIENRDDEPAYRIVMHNGLIGEYYGIQGTTWKGAPILGDPTETRMIDGREYSLHYDSDRLRMVSWETRQGVYWVSNTLLHTLSEDEMLAIATSAERL